MTRTPSVDPRAPMTRPAAPSQPSRARPVRTPLIAALAAVAVMGLAGCESRTEKAARFYASAQELLAAGDVERAMVELRNVFQNDGFHYDARKLYADLLVERGEYAEAYGQYLRLVEQYPDDVPTRLALAEMAFAGLDWDEVERHGRIAIDAESPPPELAPRLEALDLALTYRDAVRDRDEAKRGETATAARALLDREPDLRIPRRLVIDWEIQQGDAEAALADVDKALELEPESYDLHMLRLRLLADQDDIPATGEQLKRMVELFPDDETVRETLVRWFLVAGDLAGAEAFLREVAGPDDAPIEGHLAVVEFLRATQDPAAAMAELERLASVNDLDDDGTERAAQYRATLAGMQFLDGDQARAIDTLTALVDGAEPSDDVRRFRVSLAQMLSATGDRVTARSHVEDVLAQDPNQVDALQLRAAWAIDEDRPADAIGDLRVALAQEPSNYQILLLMAEAHEREGQPELAAERLGVAVDVSGGAAEPALRYVDFLRRQGRDDVAATVLADARSANPTDLRIAAALGQLWGDKGELGRVAGLADEVEALGNPDAVALAQRLRAAVAYAENRSDDAMGLLQELADSGADRAAVGQLVRAMMADGQLAEARAYLDAERANTPDDPTLALLDAALMVSEGRPQEAEDRLREVIASQPGEVVPVRTLSALLAQEGRADEARAVIDEAVAANPDAIGLLWLQASQREQDGDIAGAIAIYESLYAQDSSNLVVANNLASLLTAQSQDEATLDRAYRIARRLVGANQPAFQDTYGWIQSLRGQHDEAIAALETARAGLPEEPLVAAHLGMALARGGRADAAREALEAARELIARRAEDGTATALDQVAQRWVDEGFGLVASMPATAPASTPVTDGASDGTAASATAPAAMGADPAAASAASTGAPASASTD